MVVLTLIFVASIVSWTWHYLTPADWHWLTADQLSRIQSVIFSGTASVRLRRRSLSGNCISEKISGGLRNWFAPPDSLAT